MIPYLDKGRDRRVTLRISEEESLTAIRTALRGYAVTRPPIARTAATIKQLAQLKRQEGPK